MTYRELAHLINTELNETQKDCDLTVRDTNSEYMPVFAFSDEDTDGVLDPEHPYLILEI